MLSAGRDGFALLCAWQILLFAILGVAWSVIAPPQTKRQLWIFVWGRMVRDAAANCLPLAQVGGFVLGARAATRHGIPWSIAAASTVVDVTAEFVAQIVFAATGLLIVLARSPGSSLMVPVTIGLGLALAASAAFIWLQHGTATLFVRLGRRIAGKWFDDATERVGIFQTKLALMYSHSGRVMLSAAIHLLAWLCTGIGGWIAFHLLGADIDLVAVLAIEGLLHAVLATAFLVPGYAGVQEAAYAGLGALFGVPQEISLGVSLLRRSRDLAVGIPILLVWQLIEMRRLRIAPPA